jgi:hypothetical protein
MPICVNPKCGQISKTISLYCPSCGQQSLSRIDKGQVEGPHSTEISMENFDRISKDVPAKRETPYGLPKSKKRRRLSKSFSRPKFGSLPKPKGKKALWSIVLVLVIGLYVIAQANPSLMPQGINGAVNVVKREVVQAVPQSDAYQLGFDEGTKYRNIEMASKVLNEHFESYGMAFLPNASVDEQIRACEETVTIDPEGCASFIREQNSPEYKRKIYRQYAEDVWEPMGLLNFLENTQKNKQDFVSGFMTGLFG